MDGMTIDQKYAMSILESGQNVFLTGVGGSGKSYLVEQFVEQSRRKGKKVLLCGSTGIASVNIKAEMTMHKLFGIKKSLIGPEDIKKAQPSRVIRLADIIIIDEISMVQFCNFEYVCNQIEKASRRYRDSDNGYEIKPHKIQLIVVGDFLQLQPVYKKDIRVKLKKLWEPLDFGDGYAFDAPSWKKMKFKFVRLQQVVRQNDAELSLQLSKIRNGDYDAIQYFNMNTRKDIDPLAITLCAKNDDAKAINYKNASKFMDKITYRAVQSGNPDVRECPVDEEIALAVGMRVMSVINDIEGWFQNGSTGTIIAIEKEAVKVHFDDGLEAIIGFYTWEFQEYNVVNDDNISEAIVSTFSQIPLKLAYGISIHKSQGMSLDSFNLDPKGIFAPAQLYVALSRAKRIDSIHLMKKIRKEHLKVSDSVKTFYLKLENDLENEEQSN